LLEKPAGWPPVLFRILLFASRTLLFGLLAGLALRHLLALFLRLTLLLTTLLLLAGLVLVGLVDVGIERHIGFSFCC
jgi:hypothetical protein